MQKDSDIYFSQKNAVTEALNLLRNIINANIQVEPFVQEIKVGDALNNRTFFLLKTDFDFIKQAITVRRRQGQIKYTQANVIAEALTLLRKKFPNIE